jgi:hypothetical protein
MARIKKRKDFGDPSLQTPRYYTPIPKPYTPIPSGGLTVPPPTKKPSVITRKATEATTKPTAPTGTAKSGRTYQVGGVNLTAQEYEVAKGILGFQGGGGLVTGNVRAALAGVPGTQEAGERIAEEATPELEAAGAFEEVTPGEVSLQPERVPGEQVPILGVGAQAAIQGILSNAFIKGWLPNLEGEEGFPITRETLREAALTEIRREQYNKGISAGESFGAIIEAIPIAGGLISKYASGLTQTPSSNARDIVSEISSERERAATSTEKVRSGQMDASYALGEARNMEENIAALEGRLKLLINTSAILRANTDEVNLIQEQIFRAKERVAQFRLAASMALTAQLTGTGRIVPTDEQLYFELKEYKE